MIDWHSHVLPALDDGSKSLEESLKLFEMLLAQGVDTVIATPHFYANDETVSAFLERRDASYKTLCEALPSDAPRVLLGAEVSYYPGICRHEELLALCVEGTSLLLLEMPFSKWTEYTVREVEEICSQGSVTVALAHIERYIDMQDASVFGRLFERGALMQVNASFFNRRVTRRNALKLLGSGRVHLIGSDTHNVRTRPPQLADAYNIIEKKFGKNFIDEINEFGYSQLA